MRDRKFVQIEQDNFDQVMAGMSPRVTFQVKNRLQADGVDLRVELRFGGIADFDPTRVARQGLRDL